MTEIKNNPILIISDDITIIESIKETYNDYEIICFSHDNIEQNFKKYDLIILDDFEINKKTTEELKKYNNIINISKNKYDNITTLSRPFSLENLFFTINNFLFKKNKIMEFNNFIIEYNILKINNLEIEFGNKEISLIEYLFKNLKASKNELLENIWGYNDSIETKVLENTINKIRQKFNSLNINNFIIYDKSNYKINSIYRNIE